MSPQDAMTLTLTDVKKLATDSAAATENVGQLLTALQSDDEEMRAWASDALQTIEHLPETLASNMADLCMHRNATVALWACKLLVKVGGDVASQHQSSLRQALTEHTSIGVQQQAASSLGQVNDWTESTKAAVQAATHNADPRLSRLATQAIATNQGGE